jgi:hypothetical protein
MPLTAQPVKGMYIKMDVRFTICLTESLKLREDRRINYLKMKSMEMEKSL